MSGNHLKTPYALSADGFAQRKVKNAVQLAGKALPASVVSVQGAMVTVRFEVDAAPWTLPSLQVPLAGDEYVRRPIQAGCRGVVRPADVRLGAISGQGGSTPRLNTSAPNLSALVFEPIGTTSFSGVDPNTTTVYGEPGVLIREKGGSASVSVEPDLVTLTAGGTVVTVTPTGLFVNGVQVTVP